MYASIAVHTENKKDFLFALGAVNGAPQTAALVLVAQCDEGALALLDAAAHADDGRGGG